VASAVEALLEKMPLQILCRKSAVLSRRLAVTALVFARSFRPGTLQSLRSTQVQVTAGGKVKLSIPPRQFKNKGKGGSRGGVEGVLPDIEWIHKAVLLYRNQGRPFLVRRASGTGQGDAGFFFTPASGQRPGEKMGKKSLGHDAMVTLGYAIYGQRYLTANDAWSKEIQVESLAANLQNTAPIAKRVYARATPAQKGRRANRIWETIIRS